MCKIVDMQKQHFEEIKECLQEKFDDFWSKEILEKELENENCKYFAAVNEKNEVLGFAGIFITPDDIELMNIVTKKEKRNLGIGKKILDRIIEEYRKIKSVNSNILRLTLEVNEKNIFAIKLYKNSGFVECGRRKKYYNNQDDAILMELI